MDIVKYDVYRQPNIGIYINVNDTIGLVPMGFAETKANKLAEYLNIEIFYTAIANTRLKLKSNLPSKSSEIDKLLLKITSGLE